MGQYKPQQIDIDSSDKSEDDFPKNSPLYALSIFYTHIILKYILPSFWKHWSALSNIKFSKKEVKFYLVFGNQIEVY